MNPKKYKLAPHFLFIAIILANISLLPACTKQEDTDYQVNATVVTDETEEQEGSKDR